MSIWPIYTKYTLRYCVLRTSSLPPSVRFVAAAVPPRPEDVTVPVVVLFTIVSSCVTDCDFNIVTCPCNGPVREVSP